MVNKLWFLLACVVLIPSSGWPVEQAASTVSVFVGSGDLMPSVKRQVLPAYPVDAMPDGVVDLEIVVDAGGKVATARVVESPDGTGRMAQACVSALKDWQIRPAMDLSGEYRATLVLARFGFTKPAASGQAGSVSATIVSLPQLPLPDFQGMGELVIHDSKEPGFTWPKSIREIKPRYTPEAMRAKLQGVVAMELIVLPNGTVGAARVLKSLDAGLDRSALIAARYWYFTSPKVNGVPVAARVFLDLEYRLH